jgi:trk system potassium uptake protein TrkH
MQFGSSLRILGILLVIFSILHLPPIAVSLWFDDQEFTAFGQAFCLTLATGAGLWLLFYTQRRDLRVRDGFFIVVAMWTMLSLFGALPFVFSTQLEINFIDGFFETVSGLTTTGATSFVGLDDFPPSILYYRSQLQFLGGMGIIILAVALLPMFGIGGLQLFRAEVTGPVKDNKLAPRIKETAKVLWLVYLGLNLMCIISYWWAGMSFFDAVNYSFATISTGGFAPYDMSMGHYPDPRFILISSVFMLLGGINFALHFVVFRSLNFRVYWQDPECKIFLLFTATLVLICTIGLSHFQTDFTYLENFLRSLFMVVSIITTTGFTLENITYWPVFLGVLVFFAGLIGACSSSTTGGLKMIRAILFVKQSGREVKKLLHPSGKFPLKLKNIVVPDSIADAVWGFICIYIIIFIVVFILLLSTNLDMPSALSGAITSLANIGPGLNMLGDNASQANDAAKLIMSAAMLIGRLEIFTVLVLFTPAFWKK